ncbi:MAG: hypothetical protein VX290_14510 [Candidatus Latescibacterota bacterium]|nr:hypothetical protein [Candidatus Latescibacterota bacterium]
MRARSKASRAALSIVKVVEVTLNDSALPSGKHYMKAIVVLSMSGPDSLSSSQISNIAQLVRTSVDGLTDHHVNLMDDTGRSLNHEQRRASERKKLWTRIAINFAKVLGVLGSLVVLRFIIEVIGKRVEDVQARM